MHKNAAVPVAVHREPLEEDRPDNFLLFYRHQCDQHSTNEVALPQRKPCCTHERNNKFLIIISRRRKIKFIFVKNFTRSWPRANLQREREREGESVFYSVF